MVTRRTLLKSAFMFTVAGAIAPFTALVARAQSGRIDPAFDSDVLRALGFPEIKVHVTPEGIGAPSNLEAGIYHVTLSASDDWIAYVDFMIPPAGLDEKTATEQALAAGSQDLVNPDWWYGGGSNLGAPGVPVSFLIDLKPGAYQVAASYYSFDRSVEEVMQLSPLTVTAPGTTGSPQATPVAAGAATPVVEPQADVVVTETDELRYELSSTTIPAGPQVWKITNAGEHHAHHAVIMRVPDGTTADAIIAGFEPVLQGTPPAADSPVAQMTWVGYAALQSGGATTWTGFDFEPGTYAVICYIFDLETGMPHFVNGMVTMFIVE
ncbi:MAG: hypothetical protein WBA63_09905 [Thermomicrobiales bacterium]